MNTHLNSHLHTCKMKKSFDLEEGLQPNRDSVTVKASKEDWEGQKHVPMVLTFETNNQQAPGLYLFTRLHCLL